MSSGREGKAIVLTCFFMAGTGNWGWVFAWPVTAGTGVNGLNSVPTFPPTWMAPCFFLSSCGSLVTV